MRASIAAASRVAAVQRAREEFGQVAGLVEAVDRREDQLDRPLGREALGLERIGEAEAAHGEVGPRRAHAVELPLDVLALASASPAGSSGSSAATICAVEVGRADLDQLHAEFAVQEARERDLELRVGHQEQALAREPLRGSAPRRALARARQRARDAARSAAAATSERRGRGREPRGGALGAERDRAPRAASRRARRARAAVSPLNGCAAAARVRADRRAGRPRGAPAGSATGPMPSAANSAELVLDDVGQRSRRRAAARSSRRRQQRHQRLEARCPRPA